jgi:hypothetical protein
MPKSKTLTTSTAMNDPEDGNIILTIVAGIMEIVIETITEILISVLQGSSLSDLGVSSEVEQHGVGEEEDGKREN